MNHGSSRRPWLIQGLRPPAAGLALAALLTVNPLALNPWMGSTAARAELPPTVYAEEQRRAQLVAELRVIRTQRQQGILSVLAQVLAVKRQPAGQQLHPGQTIQLRYPLPVWHPQGWVGPSPIPVVQPGQQVSAWLNRKAGSTALWVPAAGGRSFGPSLEDLPLERP